MNQKCEEILEFLRDYPHAYAPSIREICTAVGLNSSATVHTYLKRLEKEGYIERQPKCPRCISLISKL